MNWKLYGITGLVLVILIVIALIAFPSSNASLAQTLTPLDFKQQLDTQNVVLLDVRTEKEFQAGHLNHALQSDFYQTAAFSTYLDHLDKKPQYLVYCRSGHRSALAIKIMQEKGFTHVSDMAGGYNAWMAQGLPVTTK